ncbi:MAG TPA: LacI family DNA-binding transcriptional regulator [Verrucomicrobiae bacterium]|jgi:LacI family transcriptional regulator|nr:LacI family DNA-binding transcriptional regulator [Verrucomicrobiae bacterium]
MVRLKDIAVHAAVSVMTVSKALRDEPDVSEATKVRIKSLAQQMGYVPDSSAQGLRTRTTKMLGLLISSTTDPTVARMALAIEERTHEMGYDLLLMHTLNTVEREEYCLRRMMARRVDGIFVAPVYRMEPEARIYKELAAQQPRVVLLGPAAPFCNQFPSVQVDDLLASFAATQHLIKLGHKRIAFLAGPPAAPWAQARFEGYRRALRETGMDVDDSMVFQAGSTTEDGVKAASQMLDESCNATAVQAAADLVAIGFADMLLNQGVRIPQDISVVGFGNTITSEYFRVPMTTVRQPKFRLGLAAVEIMQQMLSGQRGETKRLPAELIVRASTGEPGAGARKAAA